MPTYGTVGRRGGQKGYLHAVLCRIVSVCACARVGACNDRPGPGAGHASNLESPPYSVTHLLAGHRLVGPVYLTFTKAHSRGKVDEPSRLVTCTPTLPRRGRLAAPPARHPTYTSPNVHCSCEPHHPTYTSPNVHRSCEPHHLIGAALHAPSRTTLGQRHTRTHAHTPQRRST